MSVVLIGYRGAGKTCVGRALASVIGLPFVDCDERAEARLGMSVAEAFRKLGEPAFRAAEHEVLQALVGDARPRVIATGGGVVLDPRHGPWLRRLGEVVWLRVEAAAIEERIAGAGRPSLTALPLREEIARHLSERTALYGGVAHHEVTTDGRSVDEVVGEVARLVAAGKGGRAAQS